MAESQELSLCRKVDIEQGRFSLRCDLHCISGYISCPEVTGPLDQSTVREMLKSIEISEQIVEAGIAELLKQVEETQAVTNVLIAKGRAPVPGQDGRLDLRKKPPQRRQPQSQASGSEGELSFREKIVFDNVREGDLLAIYVPGKDGTAGLDIFGQEVRPPAVKSSEYKAGSQVVYNQEKMRFYATGPGYLELQENVLHVRPCYEVQGSVDLNVGNIDFLGMIKVHKDVQDGFEIRGDQGIHIVGVAEACTLRSQRSILIDGGIKGREKAEIHCGGDLCTRFINGARVLCDGDVFVKNEIVNSEILSFGRVTVEAGAIVNSRVVALKGIFAQDAGSDLGVKTTLIAGMDYRVVDRLLALSSSALQKQQVQQSTLNSLGAELEREKKASVPDAKRLERLKDSMANARKLQRELEEMETESGSLSSAFENEGNPVITIMHQAYSGVECIVGNYRWDCKEPRKGPISIQEDAFREELLVKTTAVLEKPARPSESDAERRRASHPGQLALVVDDELMIRDLVGEILIDMGMEVIKAKDAVEALAALESGRPISLFVLDIMMPGDHGLVLTKKIRDKPQYAKVPVLIISGHFQADKLLKVEASFKHVSTLPKPFEHQVFVAAATSLINTAASSKSGFTMDLNVAESKLILTVAPPGEKTVHSRKVLYKRLRRGLQVVSVDQNAIAEAFIALGRGAQTGQTFPIAVQLRSGADGTDVGTSPRTEWTYEAVRSLYREIVPRQLDGSGLTVMVADDTTTLRKMIRRELEKVKFGVIEAEDGRKAIKLMKKSPPDCILLDVNMPHKSGLDVLQVMAGEPKLSDIPVLLCTGIKDRQVLVAGVKLGAKGILSKPFEPDELIKKLAEVLPLEE